MSFIKHTFFLLIIIAFLFSCKQKAEEKSIPEELPPAEPEMSSLIYQVKEQLQKDPDNPDLLYHLADLYERDGLYKEEIETLLKVIKINPNRGYVYFKLGNAYSRLEKYEEAKTALIKCTKLLPNYAMAYNNLGFVYGKLGKIDKQITALEKAIELRPGYAIARFNLGIAYIKNKDISSAQKQQKALSEIDERLSQELKKEIEKAER